MDSRTAAQVLEAIEDPTRKAEARQLDALFRGVTGCQPVHWGRGLIGYGRYHYRYDSGREGDFLATGFSALKTKFSLHILPGYQDFPEIAARLGPHRRGKSCWYVSRLSQVDPEALADLIRAGLADLRSQYTVQPS